MKDINTINISQEKDLDANKYNKNMEMIIIINI